MRNFTWKRFSPFMALAGLAVIAVEGHASAGHRHRDDVFVSSSGGTTSSFCTDGDVLVVHTAKADNGSYSIGYTVLEGPQGTFRVGPGSRSLPRGCYSHWLANTSAAGRASVQSTVWYD